MPHLTRAVALALVLASTGFPARADPLSFTNRLIHSADPYLLAHAHNPVDWYPWGAEAFAAAKAENKPIFLSVGYSTCYWCHVAERTIYSDPAIAKLMNDWFVNVKVDREERPDVDRLYIDATTMLNGHGAWPNNLFLTPTGAPFYAGSTFPPKDDGDQPGFPKVLAAIHDLWTNHRAEQVTPAADEMMAALRKLAVREEVEAGPVVPRAWLGSAAQRLLRGVDPTNGGLGSPISGPKFPQAPALALLAADARLDGDAASAVALGNSLDAMALGGIDDAVGGGFFRYSTEPTWSVPHFEKMLTDNAQLLALYVGHGGAFDKAVAAATARFLLRDMQVPGGGFATALDAQTGGIEGATYLWTHAEVEAVLGPTGAARFFAVYDLTPLPESAAEAGAAGKRQRSGVLRVRLPLADTLARAGVADAAALTRLTAPMRDELLAARDGRTQPARDDKIVTGWNGLAIGALARAGTTLAAPELTAAAVKAADRIWRTAFDNGTGSLKHQIYKGAAAVDGTPEDYAALGVGFLDLAAATGDDTWHERAEALADAMLGRFLHPDGRLWAEAGLLPVALGDNADDDLPSGTSSALLLLGRLGASPVGGRFAAAQARMAVYLAGAIGAHPTTWPAAVVALAAFPPSPGALAVAQPRQALSAGPKPAAPPSTADHLHASAVRAADGTGVIVTLSIDRGFHINAHVPSFGYLVPTALAIGDVPDAAITYPASQPFKPAFTATPIDVYEGTVTVTAPLSRNTASWHGEVTAQACDDRTCLPPSTIAVDAGSGG